MATITFDTHALVKKLTLAGITQEHAEAMVGSIADAQEALVSRDYLDNRLDKVLAPIYTDLAVLKWMMGFLIAINVAVLVKLFF